MDIFSFPLKAGDASQALAHPFSVVITEKITEKFFGDENPVGKTLTIQNSNDYRIAGILEEIPGNSHLRFDALASFSSLNNTERVRGNYWDRFSNDYTYILLKEGAHPEDVQSHFPAFMAKHIPAEEDRYALQLQPLTDIHLSSLNYDVARRNNKEYLYAYSAIAVFILIIACINFMNLATARSAGRAREVGIRKVVGAHRSQLVHQFFSESVLTALLSLAAAIGLVALLLPLFNQFIQEKLSFDLWHDWSLILSLLGLCVFVGFVSGSYPALILSSFKPDKVLKNVFHKGKKGLSFRTVSIVLQFAISIMLIIATAVVYAQLHFMRNKDLGFDAKQVLVIHTRSDSLQDKIEAFKNEITRNPFITSVSASFGTPASGAGSGRAFVPEGFPEGETLHLETLFVDYDFIDTFGMELLRGRNFSRNFSTDEEEAFILNETAAKKLGWDDPIGKHLSLEDTDIRGRVIGVVKDFHYDSVEYAISPMVLTLLPFQISFTYCTVLALLISCMGIFGLASFTAEQRTKEIGIRKVLGASVQGIIYLLSKEFVKWVFVANIIAWPLAYFVMHKWLESFAYRTHIDVWIFALSGILALFIALLTVSYQSIKTAIANPIDSLRYE
jgi:putative ABC transport system permease protein